jgi:hypothetical protein
MRSFKFYSFTREFDDKDVEKEMIMIDSSNDSMGRMRNVMKIKILRGVLAVMMVAIMGLPTSSVFAAQSSASQQVTVTIPKINILSTDMKDFTLSFSDYISGSASSQQVVSYTVKSNSLNRDKGIVQAHIDTVQPGISVLADVGAYAKQGGNATLVESASGFFPLKNTDTSLCDRQIDSGLGQTTRGTFPVTYQAVALEDLASGEFPISLTITLIDA